MTATLKEQKLTDSEIQQRVIDELRWDSRVKETDVGVEADGGIVTLTGTVSSYAEKVAAVEAAYRVAGVIDVANDVLVHTPLDETPTDTDIAHAVRQALDWDSFVPSRTVRSSVTDGWVKLEGTVALFRQRVDAERAIQNLAGVKGVSNRIMVSPGMASTGEIERKIVEVLERQAQREAGEIQVTVDDGVVQLNGNVHSHAERKAIVEAVQHASNVRMVEDHLVVDPELQCAS